MSRTFWTARTAFGRDDRHIRRWSRFGSRRWTVGGGWILEVDIRKFFDNLDHGHLRDVSPATGARRSAVAADWQMAESGRDGRRVALATRTPDRPRAA